MISAADIGGYVLILNGLILAGRASLLSRDNSQWPTAPQWLRYVLIAFSWASMAYGVGLVVGSEQMSVGALLVWTIFTVGNALHFTHVLSLGKKSVVK